MFLWIYFIKKIKDVSCEFDELKVNTHLCKLRCWYLQYTTRYVGEVFLNVRGPIILSFFIHFLFFSTIMAGDILYVLYQGQGYP